MAQNGKKILLVAKIKQQINRLNNAVDNKNSKFDIKSFKTGINSDLDELEQIIRLEIDNAESKTGVEELTKAFLELREAAEEAIEKYESTVGRWKWDLLKKVLPTKATLQSIATILIFNWRTGFRFGGVLIAVAVLVIRCIFFEKFWWRYHHYYDDEEWYSYGDYVLKATGVVDCA